MTRLSVHSQPHFASYLSSSCLSVCQSARRTGVCVSVLPHARTPDSSASLSVSWVSESMPQLSKSPAHVILHDALLFKITLNTPKRRRDRDSGQLWLLLHMHTTRLSVCNYAASIWWSISMREIAQHSPSPCHALPLPLSGIISTAPISSTTLPFTWSPGGILQIYCPDLLYIRPYKEIFLIYLRGVFRAVTVRRRQIAEISYAKSSTSILQSRKLPLLALLQNRKRRPWRGIHCGS